MEFNYNSNDTHKEPGYQQNAGARQSFNNALYGIAYCFKTQRNIPLIVVATVAVLLLSWWFAISIIELLIVITAIGLVIITETVNTAIEKAVDLVTDKYHPLARLAKDVAAGGVLLAVLYSIVVGLIIFLPRLLEFLSIV